MHTYYSDLKQQLKSLNKPTDDDRERQRILDQLRHRKLSVGEGVQRLFPHVGSKSQAVLALIHIAGLVDQLLTEETLTNAMQDLLIAQHKAEQTDAAHCSDEIPEAHITDIEVWVNRLKAHGHIMGKAGKLYSNVR